MGGVNVGKVRMEMGRELARRFPVEGGHRRACARLW